MNPRRMLLRECATLALLGLLQLAACKPYPTQALLKDPPSVDTFTQVFQVSVDDDADGTPEDTKFSDVATGPGVLGTATASGEARIELTTDRDSILATCTHTLGDGGPGRTQCEGRFFGTFMIAKAGDTAEFEVALLETVERSPPPTHTTASATFNIECGSDPMSEMILLSDVTKSRRLLVKVDGGTSCTAEIIVPSMLAEGTGAQIIHTASVTALNIDPVECLDSSDCEDPDDRCGSTGKCGGKRGDPCFNAEVHCRKENPNCIVDACEGSGPGNTCQNDLHCAGGHKCTNRQCEGTACANSVDCTKPTEPVCTKAGCAASGNPGDACRNSQECVANVDCRFGICTIYVPNGESCTEPFTACDQGYCDTVCKPFKNGGESCSTNIECTAPSLSCIANLCADRSGPDGPCDYADDADCTSAFQCDVVKQTCQISTQ